LFSRIKRGSKEEEKRKKRNQVTRAKTSRLPFYRAAPRKRSLQRVAGTAFPYLYGHAGVGNRI